MKKHARYIFILGVGIGLIIASLLGLVGNKMANYQHEVMGRLAAANQVGEEETSKDQGEEKKEEVQVEAEKEQNKESETVEILIKEGLSSEEIAEILYQNQLIADKEDFKILLNLKTLDTVKAGQVLTDQGIISRGWKITQLLSTVSKKYDKAAEKMYEAKLIDDQESLAYIMGILREGKKVIPGKKIIKRGTSMNEIVQILIQ
ncbi:cell division protein YceG involved in septum cleavage [Anaerosolibacter carboniphilus]|uniref:Cell division protein YceG involved in septum cleavage n=1 Tax=Anaerosolibacter carboniphilus TaxID=1417629 RepID=A0A841KL61_9FIRM|nr:hypothetical protein [Anaerosolibacter carboniphilus]MBB6213971.1 cell division protein YceG involved in septum cleavage [Anaerosolibacter carboniphilus]